jgi:transcriptional regulatory protein RtcR
MKRKTTVIGFLGSRLDGGVTEKRWLRWRPSVGACAQPEFHIDQYEMLVSNESFVPLSDRVIEDMRSVSPDTEVHQHLLTKHDPWNFEEMYALLHDFAKGYTFRDDTDYYVHLTTGSHVSQICLFLLTEARYFPAKMLDTQPSEDRSDWRGSVKIIDLNLSSYDKLASRFALERVKGESLLKQGIATRNAAFNRMISDIEKVCLRSDAPVLLMGPTGAGKSQLARQIHNLKLMRHRIKGDLVEINCATLRGDNAMSALFGHRKGAFTGAMADRAGLLKTADGGLLFLDEIGELGLDEQAMLLRALEEKRFLPMGSDKEIESCFQLIAGTNRNLADEVARGTFRADLYARINMWSFSLPGLKDRPEDIAPNLDYELERTSAQLGCCVSMNEKARATYMDFAVCASWDGNFRDLSASVLRMGTLADGGRITVQDVQSEIQRLNSLWQVQPEKQAPVFTADLDLDDFDRVQLEYVMGVVRNSESLAEAGRKLFSVSRLDRKSVNDGDRLKKYLAKFNMEKLT